LSSQVLSAQVTARPDLEAWIRFVLVQLYYAPDHRMRRIDLARTVLLTASGITRLLDGLERTGWVCKQRCASDARVTYAVLTEAGIAKFVEAQTAHLGDLEELFGSRFTREEQLALSELLGRLPLAPVPVACGGEEAS